MSKWLGLRHRRILLQRHGQPSTRIYKRGSASNVKAISRISIVFAWSSSKNAFMLRSGWRTVGRRGQQVRAQKEYLWQRSCTALSSTGWSQDSNTRPMIQVCPATSLVSWCLRPCHRLAQTVAGVTVRAGHISVEELKLNRTEFNAAVIKATRPTEHDDDLMRKTIDDASDAF